MTSQTSSSIQATTDNPRFPSWALLILLAIPAATTPDHLQYLTAALGLLTALADSNRRNQEER